MFPIILGGETFSIADDGTQTSPTTAAIDELVRLLRLPAEDVGGALLGHPDRVGRDFAYLAGLLADDHLDSTWTTRDLEPLGLPALRAGSIRANLSTETLHDAGIEPVTGLLFRLDARANRFAVDVDEQGVLIGGFRT